MLRRHGDLIRSSSKEFKNAKVWDAEKQQKVPVLEISEDNYVYAIPPQFKVGWEPEDFDPEKWSLKRGEDSDESYVFPTAAYIELIKEKVQEEDNSIFIISDELATELEGKSREAQEEIWKNVYLKVLKIVDPEDESSKRVKDLVLLSITVYPGKPEWQQLAAAAAAQQPAAAAQQQGGRRKSTRRRKYRARKTRSRR